MEIVHDNIWLCDDCMLYHETGDASFLDYYYDEGEAARVLYDIQEGLEALGPHLVNNNDSETGEGIYEFSRLRCDCCGTTLAGGRHRYAILG